MSIKTRLRAWYVIWSSFPKVDKKPKENTSELTDLEETLQTDEDPLYSEVSFAHPLTHGYRPQGLLSLFI